MLSRKPLCKIMLASAAVLALATPLVAAPAHSQFKVIYSFTGGSGGQNPHAGLVRDTAGNLYGTTYVGGSRSGNCANGCGTAFKIAPDGTETILHSFAGGNDGQWPYGGVSLDNTGSLYGTTIIGGGNSCNGQGCGTAFKIAPDGTETVLHAFTGGTDGQFPEAGMFIDGRGNLYGTTVQGGTGYFGCTRGFGSGTIFEITRAGKEKVLYSFTGPDGCQPYSQMIRDTAGNFYGTTSFGGAIGGGTVFKFAPDGTETVLHSFGGGDGDVPESDLIMDANGNLYGTTVYGGAQNSGAVFEVASDGTESVLYSFCSAGCADGAYPYAGLFRDRKGNLYGTTAYGGITQGQRCALLNGCGTVFKLAPDGTEKVLHAFDGASESNAAFGKLIEGTDDHLYGTVYGDPTCMVDRVPCGAVFELDK